MSWAEFYPIVKEQAYSAVFRYEEPERRKDKTIELVCRSFDKCQQFTASGRAIREQDYHTEKQAIENNAVLFRHSGWWGFQKESVVGCMNPSAFMKDNGIVKKEKSGTNPCLLSCERACSFGRWVPHRVLRRTTDPLLKRQSTTAVTCCVIRN